MRPLVELMAGFESNMVNKSIASMTDDELFMRMLVHSVTKNKKKTMRITAIAVYLGDSDSLVSLINKDFSELGIVKENCDETSWIDSVLWWANYDLGTQPTTLLDWDLNDANFLKRKSYYVQIPVPKNGLESLWKKMMKLGKVGLVFNAYGGQMNRVISNETLFPHQTGNLFKIQYSASWEQPEDEANKIFTTQAKLLHEFVTSFVLKNPMSAHLNFVIRLYHKAFDLVV